MKATSRKEISGIEERVIVIVFGAITKYFTSKWGTTLDNLFNTLHPGAILDRLLGLLTGNGEPVDVCGLSIVRGMSRMICVAFEVRSSSELLALPIFKPLENKLKASMQLLKGTRIRKGPLFPCKTRMNDGAVIG